MKKRSIALVLAICVVLSMVLAGCGQKKKRDFIVPPFEKFSPQMTSEEIAEIIGVKVADSSFQYKEAKDNVLGYDYRCDTYMILQSDGVEMRFRCFINTEENILSFATFDIDSPYFGEDGITDEEMQLLQKHAEFVVNYFTERLGTPEVTTEEELTTHTWNMENGARVYLKNGVQYGSYTLELWWNYFGK